MTWEEALAEHYRTGDYTVLGIWAQDNVPTMAERLGQTSSAARVPISWLDSSIRLGSRSTRRSKFRIQALETTLRVVASDLRSDGWSEDEPILQNIDRVLAPPVQRATAG